MEQVHRQTWENRNPTVPVETENLCENETWGCVMPQCSKGQEAIKGYKRHRWTGSESNDLLPNTSYYFRTTNCADPVSKSKVDHLS